MYVLSIKQVVHEKFYRSLLLQILSVGQANINTIYICLVDWCQEAVSKAEILRLIYQGRFLHSNVTLGALGLPFGKTTVMHLVPRETLPEPNSQG